MAAEGRTVRVSGLPVDIPENRLFDKIRIHFLRKKNGGGDITSVTFSKTTPGTAFITFEDSEVASRLALQGKQVFRVSDTNYDVVVSLHHESVDVDKVLLHMSVTVDHSKLPEGKITLLALHRGFPGVHLTFDSQKGLFILDGRYTEVQSLTSLLLGSSESQTPGLRPPSWTEGKEKSPLDMPASSPVGTDGPSALTKQPLRQTEKLDVELHTASWKPGLDQSCYIHSEGQWKMEPESGACFEDFSFVVDSDIFRYLHKYCAKEYQSILRRHRVEVLDETCQDITTLYLKPKKGLSERGMGPVKRARQDLAQLYQDKGSQLRKEQISKTGIPEDGLEQALEVLRRRLPQLLIEEAEGSVYLVGSGSDVSEAKQFINDVKESMVDRELHSDQLLVHPQSNFPFSRPISSEIPPQSDIFQPLGNKSQDSDDLFKLSLSRKDHQKANKDEDHDSNERRHNYGETKYLDELPLARPFTKQPQSSVMDDDIFCVRKKDTPVERHVQTDLKRTELSGNTEKFTDFLSLFPKPSFTLDLDRRSADNPDYSSEETVFKGTPVTNSEGPEKQLKSAKVHKTKRESGRELKMAANFSREISNSSDTRNAGDLKTMAKPEEGAVMYERPPDSVQLHSLPFIKPAMNSNLKPNPSPGSGSGRSKTDILLPKGDVKKRGHFPSSFTEKTHMMMPAYSTESQPFSLGHMDLCGDAGINRSPATAFGLALKRSNSFSGRIRTGQDGQTAVDISTMQKGVLQGSQEREIFTLDVPVSKKHWLYLKSIYSTEIDNLTSDLQLKENIIKEEFTLCLRGANLEKVKECEHGLRSLIATVETDFDARTLLLSMLGVSDCKDKTLVDFCSRMKQSYERVNILALSKKVIILGPRLMCEEVEAAMMKVFRAGVSCVNAESGKSSTYLESTEHLALNSNSEPLTEHPALTTENAQVVTKKNLHKMFDQSNACISKKVSGDQTRDTKSMTADQDNRDQDHRNQGDQGRNWKNVDRKQDEERKGVESALKLQIRDAGTSNKESMKTDNLVITVRRNKEDEKIDEEHRMIPDLEKNQGMEANSQNRETKSVDPHSSVSQTGNVLAPPGGPDFPLNAGMASHVGGTESFPLRCLCGAQCSAADCTERGMSVCSKWQKEEHGSCNRSPSEAQQETWTTRGTMMIRESTITIPGFIRNTTLKIIYDIPDGIQGEFDPCPGAPFKGNRFEAFLPLNEATKKLLPLLKKAFHKGLTFTIKAKPSESQGQDGLREGRVVWGSIPHKTHIEGGTSKNGYPDSTYIRRLTQTLKTADLEE